MNGLNMSSLTEEFRQEYENNAYPILPEKLTGYRFLSCLGESDQKKTWLLEKPNGQKVLCKYASGEYVEMLRTESTFFMLGKFSFVPYVIDYEEIEDSAYLLREYIEGVTLEELIEKKGPLPLAEAISIMDRLCCHFSLFHSANPPVIFRDLKPSNVVLHPSGDCYLIDVGTVRTHHESDSPDTVFLGTLDTAAPEQFGARQTDNRTDIYALGILFHYLLTGELKIRQDKLKKLPSMAASVILKCTAFDPDNRYQDIDRLKEALHPTRGRKARIAVCAAIITTVIFTVAFLCAFFLFPKNEPKMVTFSSPLLEQAVRQAINKPGEEPVYEEDLVQIASLYICGDSIFPDPAEHADYADTHPIHEDAFGYGDIGDISLLAKMPNLHYLVLDYQQVYDLTPLNGLELVYLSLCGNPITDLSALDGQTSLRELYLSTTAVSSLTGLENCHSLSILDCSNSSVVSLEPIKELPIHTLRLTDTPIKDYGPLSAMPIQRLFCSHMSASDIASLEDMDFLKHLVIYNSGITSLKELSGLRNLEILDISNNRLTNLDGLEEFTNLWGLLINNNPITDLSPLARMKQLTSLYLATGTDIDFSFLNEMPQLNSLTIFTYQLDALYRAVPEPWFTVQSY